MAVMRHARQLARSLPWLLPHSSAKNALLNRLGHDIDPSATIGPVLAVRVARVEVGEDATIGALCVLKDLERVHLGRNAVLSGWNLVSAAAPLAATLSAPSELVLEESAVITTRHTIDCSAAVTLEPFSILAGHGSQILTHSVDVRRNAQSASPVVIGERSFVGTRVVLLGGASIPSHSVVAAGSVVTSSPRESSGGSLIAGAPAKAKGPISGEWFTREAEATNAIYDPQTGITTPNAF